MTILHDIQRRPKLPPPPIEEPWERYAKQLWTYSYLIDEEQLEDAEDYVEKSFEKDLTLGCRYRVHNKLYKEEVPLVYYLPYSLVNHLEYNESGWELFASEADSGSSSKYRGKILHR